jgi:hypothetical protein
VNTQTDAEVAAGLRHALKRERTERRQVERELKDLKASLAQRVAELEQRQRGDTGFDAAAVSGGLASIRSELAGQLAQVRAELEELADLVHVSIRN